MMRKLCCPYCGQRLEDGCECESEASEYENELIEELEERQNQGGFYAFQDMMDAWRRER